MLGCFSDEHVTRDSCKGKVQDLLGKNMLFLQGNIRAIWIDTNQTPKGGNGFWKVHQLLFRLGMTQQCRCLASLRWLTHTVRKQKGAGNARFWGDQQALPAALCFSPFSPCRYRPLILIQAAGRCPFWDVCGWAWCLRRGCNSPFSSGARAGATSGCTFTGDDFSHHYSHPVLHRLIKTSI